MPAAYLMGLETLGGERVLGLKVGLPRGGVLKGEGFVSGLPVSVSLFGDAIVLISKSRWCILSNSHEFWSEHVTPNPPQQRLFKVASFAR